MITFELKDGARYMINVSQILECYLDTIKHPRTTLYIITARRNLSIDFNTEAEAVNAFNVIRKVIAVGGNVTIIN